MISRAMAMSLGADAAEDAFRDRLAGWMDERGLTHGAADDVDMLLRWLDVHMTIMGSMLSGGMYRLPPAAPPRAPKPPPPELP